MKTQTLLEAAPNENEEQLHKLQCTAKFQRHGAFVIGFNLVLALAIYGAVFWFK